MKTPTMYMKTVYVDVEKRMLLRPWKKKKVQEQWRELTQSWHYLGYEIPNKFRWNGSNSPKPFHFIISPWKHPKASGLHDYLCEEAQHYMNLSKKASSPEDKEVYKNKAIEIREVADMLYGELVGGITGKVGYAAVRVGSTFGAGW